MNGTDDSADGETRRLEHCIRDLAALNALPTLCVGRSLDETLDIAMDALPTVLGCELLLLSGAKLTPEPRARLDGKELNRGTPFRARVSSRFRHESLRAHHVGRRS